MSNEIATLPISARLRFIYEALQREMRMRDRVLKGSDRQSKVKEMETCLEYLMHVDAALSRAKHKHAAALDHLHEMIDGGEECRGRDSGISDVIRLLEGAA